tara:strand:+ start:3822 stop:5360 length:1539 start_codon:yes stop_codon:yes gene_type:complete
MLIHLDKTNILEPFTKVFDPGVYGLMGPSGSGKTTFMNEMFRKYPRIAYVAQDAPMYDFLTVEEYISISFQLSMNENPDSIINTMDLENCRKTVISKISGGERKRVSIAIELGEKPDMFLFDEPFSSLDSRTTMTTFDMLKDKLCHIPVLISIHQPSGYLFYNFQEILFMSKGVVIHDGSPSMVQQHFEQLGYEKLAVSSVPEFAIDICQVIENPKRINPPMLPMSTSSIDEIETVVENTIQDVFFTFIPIIRREFIQNTRNPTVLKTRLLQSVIFGFFVGLLFFQLGDGQVDVQNKTGALFFIILNQIMSNVFSTVESFPSYLKMFKYDYKRGKYPLLVYYLSKTSVDIPFQLTSTFIFCIIALLMTNLTHRILEFVCVIFFVALSGSSFGYMMSTVSDQFSVCIIATNLCILPMMLTSGLFINNTSVPVYIAWLQELNPFYFGYNALSTLIWKNESIRCVENELCPYSSGDDVLNYQGISTSNNTITLFGLIILFRVMGYIIMCIRLRRI